MEVCALEGYEMLKGLAGISTHESCEEVPVFENSQNMNDLSAYSEIFFSSGLEQSNAAPISRLPTLSAWTLYMGAQSR